MIRYKIVIEYDGSNYFGWQKQPDKLTIASEIEDAIFKVTNQKVGLMGSGRTDGRVHALGQVAHFDCDKDLSKFKMKSALNFYLQEKDIAILDCQIVDENFHARFSAKMRHYCYKIINRRAHLTLDKKRYFHVPYSLDEKKMQEAADFLIGQHDFSSFQDSECQAQSPIRTIKEIKVMKNGDEIRINVSAPSFLHHMVRNIAGTLVMAGGGKIDPCEIRSILEARDRKKSGPNLPACGLYFVKVDY